MKEGESQESDERNQEVDFRDKVIHIEMLHLIHVLSCMFFN